jgi:AcrR family transcriptional regulator
MQPQAAQDQSDLTPRQGEVLDFALGLLVSVGDKLTMNGVAKAASCSKETLYNWFGDREGLLVATVQWQAAKVGLSQVDLQNLNAENLQSSVEQFGRNLLSVLTSKTSVALNRVAIARASTDNPNLGAIVLQNGRFAMGRHLKPLLEAGKAAGLLKYESSEEAFVSFFGLLVGDQQIRLLLGENLFLSQQQIAQQAHLAVKKFMRLYAT